MMEGDGGCLGGSHCKCISLSCSSWLHNHTSAESDTVVLRSFLSVRGTNY